ncbi:MAG TPA: hypothetical protein VHU40_11800 [Polyangia bacterium]|nr:hypothetical protein [Polyangia bacterium]
MAPALRALLRCEETGKLRRPGHTWIIGAGAVYIGFHQHGKVCGLEMDSVFEEPPPGARRTHVSNPKRRLFVVTP